MLKVAPLDGTDFRVWSSSALLREMALIQAGSLPGAPDRQIAVLDMLAPVDYRVPNVTTGPDTASVIGGLTAVAPPGMAGCGYMVPNSSRETPDNAADLARESLSFFRRINNVPGAAAGWRDHTPSAIPRGRYYQPAGDSWLAVNTAGVRPFDDFRLTLDLSKPSEIVREVLPLFLMQGEFPSATRIAPVTLGQHMLEGGHTNAVLIVDSRTLRSFDLGPVCMPVHRSQQPASEVARLVTAHCDPDRYDPPEELNVEGALIYSQHSGIKDLLSGLLGDWSDPRLHQALQQEDIRQLIRVHASRTFCVEMECDTPVCALLINEIPGSQGGLYGLRGAGGRIS